MVGFEKPSPLPAYLLGLGLTTAKEYAENHGNDATQNYQRTLMTRKGPKYSKIE